MLGTIRNGWRHRPGYLTLRLGPNGKCGDDTFTVADRLAQATEWVMNLDAQNRDLIHAGRSPQVNVPAAPYPRTGRAHRETSADYRKLRHGVGELIRALLLDSPELKELYPFQRRGTEWLSDQHGAILADDMGLGKTVQVIAAMRLLFNRAMLRSVLVVCPKGLDAVERLAQNESAAWTRVLNEVGMERLLPESAPIANQGSG